MKSNFTSQEIAEVVYSLGNIFNVSINKAGNLKLRWRVPLMSPVYYFGDGEKYYTFYKRPEGIILRGMTKTKNGIRNSYPLNMKRTKQVCNYGDNTWTYQAYNINDSYFNNIEDALKYFNEYIEKYHSLYALRCRVT